MPDTILNINYMHYRRSVKYQKITFYFIKKIKPENKKKICVNLLVNTGEKDKRWLDLKEELEKAGIKTHIENFGRAVTNYMEKTHWAAQQDVSYSAKLDEDVFISNYTWDYLIENLGVLDREDVAILTVQLSNGIPSCEYIIDDFFDEAETFKIRTLFKGKKFEKLWSRDYSSLNIHTVNNDGQWNYKDFFDSVRNIQDSRKDWPIYYKGIHPIRIHPPCHGHMNEFIISNFQYFVEPQKFFLKYKKSAYMTNCFFIVNTKRWKEGVIDRKELFLANTPGDRWADKFDEVALNQYRERNDLFFVFVGNSLCIHTMYKILKQPQQETRLVDSITKHLFSE